MSSESKNSEFNSCASLVNENDYKEAEAIYDKLMSEGKDPAQTMMEMQHSLQVKLAETYPERNVIPPRMIKTAGQLFDLVRDNRDAIYDEFRELIDAIPGMSTPAKDRSGIWKKWKKNHNDIRAENISDMSPEDKLELLFEIIDAKHFFMNMELALGLSAKDIFILYFLKNAENFRRANSGY